jgi:hypothetical protein
MHILEIDYMPVTRESPKTTAPNQLSSDCIDGSDLFADRQTGWVTFDDLGNAVWQTSATRPNPSRQTVVEPREESILDHLDIEDLRIVETKALQSVRTVSGKLDLGQRFNDRTPSTATSSMVAMLKRLGRR